MSTTEPTYYAVPDLDTGDMTYWMKDKRGRLKPWPLDPPARYGPQLIDALPKGLGETERFAWARRWWDTVGKPWDEAIKAAIAADPEAAHARFAVMSSRCCVCGRVLTDDDSKVWGVGPECRHQVSESFLQQARREIAEAHAQGLKPVVVHDAPVKKPAAERKPPRRLTGRFGGDAATIVGHDAVMGRWERQVRQWAVREVRPYAQHPVSVCVVFIEPGKRTPALFTVVPGTRYLTIESGGNVLYDSRSDVPCDMDEWAATNDRFVGRRALNVSRFKLE